MSFCLCLKAKKHAVYGIVVSYALRTTKKLLGHAEIQSVPSLPPSLPANLEPKSHNQVTVTVYVLPHQQRRKMSDKKYKLHCKMSYTDKRKQFFFTMRSTSYWNNLPRDMMESLSLEVFRMRLDRELGNLTEVPCSLEGCTWWSLEVLSNLGWSVILGDIFANTSKNSDL